MKGQIKDIVIMRSDEFSYNILKKNKKNRYFLWYLYNISICAVSVQPIYSLMQYQASLQSFISLARKLLDLLPL